VDWQGGTILEAGGIMEAEGWYVDPYRKHEARWFSSGAPTGLVSDGGKESTDSPPDVLYTGSLDPIDQVDGFAHWDKDDPARRDDEEIESVMDVLVESGGD
jgi:hypothetical protein